MKLQPLGNKILVRPEPKADKSPGGIILPDNAKEKPLIGEIVAVGPGKTVDGVLVPMSVKVGQKVIYTRWAGSEVKEFGEDLVMSEDDLLGIVLE